MQFEKLRVRRHGRSAACPAKPPRVGILAPTLASLRPASLRRDLTANIFDRGDQAYFLKAVAQQTRPQGGSPGEGRRSWRRAAVARMPTLRRRAEPVMAVRQSELTVGAVSLQYLSGSPPMALVAGSKNVYN